MPGAVKLDRSITSLSVLVVDDDVFTLSVVEDMLIQIGLDKILKAKDGLQGLECLDTEDCQIIICDLNMPGMDGIEFFRHLAKRDYKGSVIISSVSDIHLLDAVATLVKEHQLNLLGTLHKPFELKSLEAIINNHQFVKTRTKGFQPDYPRLSVDELTNALDTGRIEVFFQPKVVVRNQQVSGAECLVRIKQEDGKILSPLAFIDVAEKYNLIDRLTNQVFEKAVITLGKWLKSGLDLKLSINLSEHNLHQLSLPEQLAETATKSGVEPNRIILELTETSVGENLRTSLDIVTRLRLLGFGLSIDDFGTGYSSMEKLGKLPFTELKVDRQFVASALTNDVSRKILNNSIQLGKDLNMNVVAEGVETEEERVLLTSLECDEIQGYFYAKPMPASEFIEWLEEYSA